MFNFFGKKNCCSDGHTANMAITNMNVFCEYDVYICPGLPRVETEGVCTRCGVVLRKSESIDDTSLSSHILHELMYVMAKLRKDLTYRDKEKDILNITIDRLKADIASKDALISQLSKELDSYLDSELAKDKK